MILTSWDDGAKDDLMVLSLLRKYKLPAIFFVPIESWGFLNLNVYNGFKVGGHTYRHPQDLKLLSPEELEALYGHHYFWGGLRKLWQKKSGTGRSGFVTPGDATTRRLWKE